MKDFKNLDRKLSEEQQQLLNYENDDDKARLIHLIYKRHKLQKEWLNTRLK